MLLHTISMVSPPACGNDASTYHFDASSADSQESALEASKYALEASNRALDVQARALAYIAAAGPWQTMLPRTISMLPAQIARNLRWKHQNVV
jgi:hypothetical protein